VKRGLLLAAAAASLTLSLPLRWAGELGFYDSDHNQIVHFLDSHRSLGASGTNLFRYVMTDEPLFNVYHGVRYWLLGDEPRPHHLAAGLLLAANGVLAFWLVWRLSRNAVFSFVFLLLFLTYPNRGEAYLWPGAAYVPMLLLLLAGAHCFLGWLEGGRRRAYAAAWAAYSAAVFTHEAAFGFLAVFGGLWWLRRRGSLLCLGPLAAANAAYLVVRQSNWFGWGDPGFSLMRTLEPGRWPDNLVYSFRTNFGGEFLRHIVPMLEQGAASQSMAPALLLMAAALAGVATLSGGRLRRRLWGALLAGAGLFLAALVYSTRPGRLPDLVFAVRVLLPAVVVLAAVAAAAGWLWSAPVDRGLLRLAGFGLLWFAAAYAPTYFLYVAPRHSYLPSFGACLLLAAAVWLPVTATAGEDQRRVLEGAALMVTALVATAFWAACLGEGRRWTQAAQMTSKLRQQLLEARPRLPADTRVVILDVPAAAGAPLLPNYALEAALRHWYRNREILAGREFIPRKQDFLFPYVQQPQPYDRLLLYTYDHQRLAPAKYLEFEDGSRVRLGERVDAGGDVETAVRVRAGELTASSGSR